LRHNQLVQTGFDQIVTALNHDSIPVIVLEEIALQRTLYDDPGLRVMSDIDLLVDDPDIERASPQLHRIGLRPSGNHSDDRRPRCYLHLVPARPRPLVIPVKLHRRLAGAYQPYVFDLRIVRAQARPLPGSPAHVRMMAPEHELAYLCLRLD